MILPSKANAPVDLDRQTVERLRHRAGKMFEKMQSDPWALTKISRKLGVPPAVISAWLSAEHHAQQKVCES